MDSRRQPNVHHSSSVPYLSALAEAAEATMNVAFESPTRKRRIHHSHRNQHTSNSTPFTISNSDSYIVQKLPLLSPLRSNPRVEYSPRKTSSQACHKKDASSPLGAKRTNSAESSKTVPHGTDKKSRTLVVLVCLCTCMVFALLVQFSFIAYHGLPEPCQSRIPNAEATPVTSSGLRMASSMERQNGPNIESPMRNAAPIHLNSLQSETSKQDTSVEFMRMDSELDAVSTNTTTEESTTIETADESDTHETQLHDATIPPSVNSLETESANSSDNSAAFVVPSEENASVPLVVSAEPKRVVLVQTDAIESSLEQPSVVVPPEVVTAAKRFAYAYVVGGCDHAQPVYRNFLYNILVNTHTIRQEGSEGDVIVFIQMSFGSNRTTLPENDLSLLSTMNIRVQYIPPAADESFDQLMMEKFRILDLTEYERVAFLDADILLRGSLDYLIKLSMLGVFKKNIVFAGRYVPAIGGIFVVTPGKKDEILEIMRRSHTTNRTSWDEVAGWGHAFEKGDYYELINGKKGSTWDFRGASSDQGLLYHWTKYEEKSVSIVMRNNVVNFEATNGGNVEIVGTVSLDALIGMSTAHTCWETFMAHKPCKAPHSDFLNFAGPTKPWLESPPASFQTVPEESPSHFWFHTLSALNDNFNLGIDFDRWNSHQRPLLGFQPYEVASLPSVKSKLQEKTSDFVYYYVIGGCDPNVPAYRNFINNVLINTHLQRTEGSQADVLVFFQMSHGSGYDELPEIDSRALKVMNINTVYLPKTEHESFERLMFDKFRILGLTQYKRAIYMDADIMVRGSLDYLFHMSMKGKIKGNLVFSGRIEPAMGGLFMLAPKEGDWDRLLSIIRDKEARGTSLPAPYFFDETQGWGHAFTANQTYEMVGGKKGNLWDFNGASSDQGLLYDWVRFENKHSVSIVQKDTVQNFVNGVLKETISISVFDEYAKNRDCWTAVLSHKPCLPPHSDYVHFPGHKKPWMKRGPPDDLLVASEMSSPSHFWYRTLMTLNEKLELGLNFSLWENNLRPLLGARANADDKAGITYVESTTRKFAAPYMSYKPNATSHSRFAYAYIVGGCKPEDPAYRNYFNDILISTYLQREEGSQADVVIFVQMAFESSYDVLPETDKNLLRAGNIIIEYIPKAEDESFYRIMMDKFRVLALTQYERVLFMDADVMALGNLDYLFELSVAGVIKQNLVVAGQVEPASGGFFMVTPSDVARDRLVDIIRETKEHGSKLPYPHWDDLIGWGHVIDENDYYEFLGGAKKTTWDFYGAFADQGLLYHFSKYEQQSVSIVFRNTVQNWDVDPMSGKVHLEETLNINIFQEYIRSQNHRASTRACWKEIMMHKPCVAPHSDFVHFTGVKKPWLQGPPEDWTISSRARDSPHHYWYATLSILNEKMHMGLDFQNWRAHHRPPLGMFPTHIDASSTSYASRR